MRTLPIQGELRDEVIRALGESPWFRALQQKAENGDKEAPQLDKLIASADLVEFDSGETILRQDYPSDSFHVVVRGSVNVRRETSEGELDLGTLRRPAAFGEVGLLLDEPRTATVVAEGPVLALGFSAIAFHGVFEKIPEFGLETSRHLARRLRDLTAMVKHPTV